LIEHQDSVGVLGVAAKSARKRLIAAVETQGRTSAKSSPVAGRTAAKMEADANRLAASPGGRWPLTHQR
jgi:hypothetical protein